jgi:glucose/arabinose dehydrogenase
VPACATRSLPDVSGRRARRLAIWLASGMAIAAMLAGSAPAGPQAPLTVRVDARDFSFKLSRLKVPAGSTVRFVVHNRGLTVHDFVVKGKRTRKLKPGRSQTIAVTFARKGAFRFLCSVSGHARLGMKGTFAVGKAIAPAPEPDPTPVTVSGAAALTRIGTFVQPVLVTGPAGDGNPYVAEQNGTVRVVRDGEVLARPFLDLRDQVTWSGESGLLSVAFAPDYAQSGRLYVFYNSRSGSYGDTRISEFRRSTNDPDVVEPSSERVLLTIPKPFENHNGGMLQFGPDGYLYASVGDGDPGVLNPAGFFAQRLDVLLGKILRIDPRHGEPFAIPPSNPFVGVTGARPEIWAYGLRNPWRFWIDPETGSMIIGDVGSTSREELNFVARGKSGQNFGWPCFEGTLVFDPDVACTDPVSPVLEIPRENGVCALIGGVVVRDARLARLGGRFLYGDLCTGKLTAISIEGGRVTDADDLGLEVPGLTSFGVDGVGRVYAMSLQGDAYRLDPTGS